MRSGHGFTLIELIVVIVLLGVMAAGAGLLITRPIEAYNDQVRRQQLVDLAEMALRKIAVDIRAAVPNSVRVVNNSPNGWVLEMVNVVDGARYRDEPGGGVTLAENILDFSAPDSEFNILGRFSNLATGAHNGLRVAIYTTNTDIYADAAGSISPGVISAAGLQVDPGTEQKLTLSGGAHEFEFNSPGQRLFVVDGPVSYLCSTADGLLTRYDGYGFQAAQIATAAGFAAASANSGRVASRVARCGISYQPGTSQRGGLITLDLSIRDAATNEQVRLLHQVHVDNVP
jgi:MSHA biogenesis protein MshO